VIDLVYLVSSANMYIDELHEGHGKDVRSERGGVLGHSPVGRQISQGVVEKRHH
jgi:hypothetical protein